MDSGHSITVDSTGNAFLTGAFKYTAIFGAQSLTSSGIYDIFAAKLDPNGNWLWAVRAGGPDSDQAYQIDVDGFCNALLTGEFYGTATFGAQSLTSSGIYDIFAAKLDQNGNWLWAIKAGGTDYDYGSCIAVDGSGNAYLTGNFSGTASLGSHNLTSYGCFDIFAAKLDQNGNWLWAVKAGGTDLDYGQGIAVDSAGNAFLTGNFSGTATFGAQSLTSNGYCDIFVAKTGLGTPVDEELHPPVIPCVLSASPNPFATSTVIAVAGDKLEDLHANASLDIYDLRGRKVRSLALDAGSGNISLNWDGRDERGIPCPNGIYLARLKLGGRRATLKISLVK